MTEILPLIDKDAEKKRSVQVFWDNHPCGGTTWKSAELKRAWKHRQEPWLPKIIERMPLVGNICLEIGCGTGIETFLLAKRASSVIAMDLSSESLKEADKNLRELGVREKVLLIQADAERLPFRASSLPAVFSNAVLDHTPKTRGAIEELGRVVRPGGQATVMLYRRYTPLQAVVTFLRRSAWLLGRLTERPSFLIDLTYKIFKLDDKSKNPRQGTGFQELFNSPVLKSYSISECRRMFFSFDQLRFRAYHNGFGYFSYFLPKAFGPVRFLLTPLGLFLDRIGERWFGFYLFIFADKDSL